MINTISSAVNSACFIGTHLDNEDISLAVLCCISPRWWNDGGGGGGGLCVAMGRDTDNASPRWWKKANARGGYGGGRGDEARYRFISPPPSHEKRIIITKRIVSSLASTFSLSFSLSDSFYCRGQIYIDSRICLFFPLFFFFLSRSTHEISFSS